LAFGIRHSETGIMAWRGGRGRRFGTGTIVGVALLALALLYLSALSVRFYARKYHMFLPDYVRWELTPAPVTSGPTHVLYLIADHFEPAGDAAKVERWLARYRDMAAGHRDSVGRRPQHTFFYHGEQATPEILALLRGAVEDGLGEVEMHYHHANDTLESFTAKLGDAVRMFQEYGFLRTVDGETRFGFVHGNWALDNSVRGACGVNTEIRMLREMGCYADFTFPSIWWEAQPPYVNIIYAAKDDPRPKSYVDKYPLEALEDGRADLMLLTGPLVMAPSLSLRRLFIDVDDGNVHASLHASPRRVDRWVRANIHVPGRPEWVFLKVYSHGISTPGDEESNVGRSYSEALRHLETAYNDGERYVLHYVNAREAYNVARAAVNGASGNPQQYLDAYVGRYVADPRTRGTPEQAPAPVEALTEAP
jgi:hypothetical protein